jgi:thioredoxin-like negative regulator of GroEL
MRLLAPFILVAALCSCTSSDPVSLCDRFFTPYPDHVSQRPRTARNTDLVDAMALYSDQDYKQAITGLQRVVDRDARNVTARIYLISALLAAGDPYKAEMHLDFMESYQDRSYSDQVDWYNAMCWLCEGNNERALKQAEWIASRPHTYRTQAADLVRALNKR